jgi:hypothetical protein
MNLRSARVALRMRGAADILDLAGPFCLGGWRLLLPLAGLTLLPSMAVCLIVHRAFAWPWPAVWCLAVVLGGLCHAPFTLAYGDLLFQDARQVRVAPILSRLLRRLPVFLVAHVTTRVIHLVGASTVILLPFTAGALFAVHEAVLLEGAGPFEAIARSGRAVRGQGLSAVGISIALVLLPIAGVFAGEMTGSALVETVLQFGQPFGSLWTTGGTPYALAGFFASIPLVVAARFLKYTDLRTRKEGWDIQLRFMAIATADAGKTGGDREAA